MKISLSFMLVHHKKYFSHTSQNEERWLRLAGKYPAITMRSNGYRLNSRASSATLSLRRQKQDAPNLFADDASIAQNLLRGQVIPARRSSIKIFSSNPNISSGLGNDGPSNTNELSNIEQQPRVRRGLCSSNTWTSSSAGGESENDDSDDRTQFIEEFNRLAEKVCGSMYWDVTNKLMFYSMVCGGSFQVNMKIFL